MSFSNCYLNVLLTDFWCFIKNHIFFDVYIYIFFDVLLKIRLYEAYVSSILTYNACTWALTKIEMKKVDALRRRHFRSIIFIKFPDKITNEELYRRCKVKSLDIIIRETRWKMFGHTLRMNDKIPAKSAMIRYFDPVVKGFQGRPRTTLPVALNQDLTMTTKSQILRNIDVPKTLKTIEDLRQFERLARERRLWKTVVAVMRSAQEPQSETKPHERARRTRNAL